MVDAQPAARRFATLAPHLSERQRRLLLAVEASELGRGGVNITDMALYPTADRSSGVVALWIAGPDAAAHATELIGDLGHPVARP